MIEHPPLRAVPSPGTIVTAILGFLIGGLSMAFNPFLAVSIVALGLSSFALRGAARVDGIVVQGVLRILAVIGIMGGLGGIMLMLFPGLGVRG